MHVADTSSHASTCLPLFTVMALFVDAIRTDACTCSGTFESNWREMGGGFVVFEGIQVDFG